MNPKPKSPFAPDYSYLTEQARRPTRVGTYTWAKLRAARAGILRKFGTPYLLFWSAAPDKNVYFIEVNPDDVWVRAYICFNSANETYEVWVVGADCTAVRVRSEADFFAAKIIAERFAEEQDQQANRGTDPSADAVCWCMNPQLPMPEA